MKICERYSKFIYIYGRGREQTREIEKIDRVVEFQSSHHPLVLESCGLTYIAVFS